MEKNRELACEILELFEELLDKYNLVIDSEDRKKMILSGENNVAAILSSSLTWENCFIYLVSAVWETP